MDTGPQLRVKHNEELLQYEGYLGDELVGLAAYRLENGKRVFNHTEVQPHHQGKGAAAQLVRAALDDTRHTGVMIVPSCSYVEAFVRRHPEYRDLVAD